VRLSVAAIEALRSLDQDVRLTVFYAEWCHSCPYAEGMVERMAEVSERIDYRFVDVDVRPELAARYGIVRAGRTVVPAIVRDGSNRVLFGVDNLEERLLDLVGAGR
jgi:thiol-disulfide isomerase/thioredoxin